jgi:hypothetical protein
LIIVLVGDGKLRFNEINVDGISRETFDKMR